MMYTVLIIAEFSFASFALTMQDCYNMAAIVKVFWYYSTKYRTPSLRFKERLILHQQ